MAESMDMIMGDDRPIFSADDSTLHSDMCRRCLKRPRRPYYDPPPPKVITTTTTMATTTEDELLDDDLSTDEPEIKRDRRSYPEIDRTDK